MILVYAMMSAYEDSQWKPLGLVATVDEATRLCEAYAQQPVCDYQGQEPYARNRFTWYLDWEEVPSTLSLEMIYQKITEACTSPQRLPGKVAG